jgi:hypothetical protein
MQQSLRTLHQDLRRARVLLRRKVGESIAEITAIDCEGKEPQGARAPLYYFPGSSLSSCALAACTPASVNASVKVLLLYQASQWSM